MEVYVITEYDYVYRSTDILGVADSPEKAKQLIDEYYKEDKFTVKNFRDVRDSNIEFVQTVYLESINQEMEITVKYFNVNQL